MCTLSWLRRAPDAYEVFFNRDERRTRGPERPPRVEVREGIAVAMPVDSDHGGTWIAANAAGVTLCLLNGAGGAAKVPPRSRGLLLVDLAPARSLDDAVERLNAQDLDRCGGFTVLAFAPGEPALAAQWTEGRLAIDRAVADGAPWISSSFADAAVLAARRRAWDALHAASPPDERSLLAFHRSHAEGPSAWSVCMHRDDGETRSFTRVRVDASSVAMDYVAGAPCRDGPAARVELARA